MAELLQAFSQFFVILGDLLLQFLLAWAILIAWTAWWLWGVDWRKAWPILAQGAWLPFVLIFVVGGFVWSRLAPSDCSCLGFVTIPNFWWQLGATSLLACYTLFCGWLQGVYAWEPAEISFDPPPVASGHGHAHH